MGGLVGLGGGEGGQLTHDEAGDDEPAVLEHPRVHRRVRHHGPADPHLPRRRRRRALQPRLPANRPRRTAAPATTHYATTRYATTHYANHTLATTHYAPQNRPRRTAAARTRIIRCCPSEFGRCRSRAHTARKASGCDSGSGFLCAAPILGFRMIRTRSLDDGQNQYGTEVIINTLVISWDCNAVYMHWGLKLKRFSFSAEPRFHSIGGRS